MLRDYSILKPDSQKPKPNFEKSCAQVASSATPHATHAVSHAALPHSAGRRPIPRKLTSRTRSFRFKSDDFELIEQKAKEHGMSMNAYVCAKALGHDYIERPPSWLRGILLKLYAELAGQGNNLNQLARKVHRDLETAEAALTIADWQRQPVFKALQLLELALSGRRPPDDY